ncbi:MAG: radical SAM protein [Deltaproteobacteria bacterium]|nr:radical SAM protein [Deltaproteobacteria bacterium]
MFSTPINYNYPLFRPPSEARSLILQVTLGCSWNRCAFCEMYRSKEFSIRDEKAIFNEIEKVAQIEPHTRRVFLADGDAMMLPTESLLRVLDKIRGAFPGVQRISSYALPRNLLKKSASQLKELHEAGLKLLYVGIESGDDEVLKRIKKGETAETTIKGLLMAKAADIKSSVIIINGLGGAKLSEQHALGSAGVLNATQPEYASTLVISFPHGRERFVQAFGNDYVHMSQRRLFEEMRIFIEATTLECTVFRSDHASNYLSLKGILGRDKTALLDQIAYAIAHPEEAGLREEWQRGL